MTSLSSAQFQQLPMFMTPNEVASLRSGDFGGEVADSRGHMEKAKKADWHTSEKAFGGPKPYLDHLTQSVNESEGIVSPIRVRHFSGGVYSGRPATLYDGHHRAVVAMETGRLVPVTHDEIRRSIAIPAQEPVSVPNPSGAKRKQPYALGKFA